MPLIRFDAIAGRSEEEIGKILDAAHRAMVSAFRVVESDRYQIFHEHPAGHLRAQDTGLGIRRTKNLLFVSLTSRERSDEMKEKFYAELCRELKGTCGIEASDVIVSIVTNELRIGVLGTGRRSSLPGGCEEGRDMRTGVVESNSF